MRLGRPACRLGSRALPFAAAPALRGLRRSMAANDLPPPGSPPGPPRAARPAPGAPSPAAPGAGAAPAAPAARNGNGNGARNGAGAAGSKRRRRAADPAGLLRRQIDQAAKEGSVAKAVAAFREAEAAPDLRLSAHACNVVLHLCVGGDAWEGLLRQKVYGTAAAAASAFAPGPGAAGAPAPALEEVTSYESVQDVVRYMTERQVPLTEMSLTALARAAAVLGEPGRAFDHAREACTRYAGGDRDFQPRLRTFTPALIAYCAARELDKVWEVDATLADNGIHLTENEHAYILDACVAAKDEARSMEALLRMEEELPTLRAFTMGVVRKLFGFLPGPGGRGWAAAEATVDAAGVCAACGATLRVADLEPEKMRLFAEGVARLAFEREAHKGADGSTSFRRFQGWLEAKGPFDVVVDGANVAMFGQAKANSMNPRQLGQIVAKLRRQYPQGKILVILHNRRVDQLKRDKKGAQILDGILRTASLYSTPTGSNDDWYWMYAAVVAGAKGLLVSNDEMRDHIFQLLSPKYFHKWKACRQVKFDFWDDALTVIPPPPFTTCIQHEEGAWHVPSSEGGAWLCLRRER